MERIQIISIVASITLLFFILILIRNRKLKEEYSLFWLLFSFILIGLSAWKNSLDWFAAQIGIAYAPAALFLVLIMAIFMILIEMSLIISKQSEWIKLTAQDIGVLKMELEELERKNKEISRFLIEEKKKRNGKKDSVNYHKSNKRKSEKHTKSILYKS